MGAGHDEGLLVELDEGAGDVDHVLRLQAEVELLGDRLGEQLDQCRRVGQGGHRDAAHQPGGDPGHDGEVLLDQPVHLGALDLDHHVLAGPQRGGVDLGDRRGRQRLLVEAVEHLPQGPAEVLLHHLADRLPRLGWHLVTALLELGDQRLGEDALTGGDDLAELDVGRAEPLRRMPQPTRQVGDRLVAPVAPLARGPEGHSHSEVAGGRGHPRARRQLPRRHQPGHLGPHRRPDVVEPGQPGQPVELDLPRTVVRERPQLEIIHALGP
jgi:hypothetical protein